MLLGEKHLQSLLIHWVKLYSLELQNRKASNAMRFVGEPLFYCMLEVET